MGHKIYLLLLVPLFLLSQPYNQDEVCEKAKVAVEQAKMIHKKFNDPRNALLFLNATDFRSITHRKPECMNDKKYLSYLDYFSSLDADPKNAQYNHGSLIEQFIRKYPDHLNFYKTAGLSYENQYKLHKNLRDKEKSLKYYKKYIALAKKKNVEADKKILAYLDAGGLRKAKSTWGKYLNPKNIIPKGRFQAIYINTNNPKKVVASEVVENVSVNYAYNKFHAIESQHFGGYWVGNFYYPKETKKMIYVSQSRATTRVIIDGYVVYDGENRGGVPYTFTKGEHKIEVEYLNHWHTTRVSVKIMKKVVKYNRTELQEALEKIVTKDTKFNYVGVHESDNKKNSITLRVQKSIEPVVLLLRSQRAIRWKISNALGAKIQAIVVYSSSPESDVSGDIKGVKIFHTKFSIGRGDRSGIPNPSKKCICIAGHYSCSSAEGFTADVVPQMFSRKVSGFSGKYRTNILSVPEIEMTSRVKREIKDYQDKVSKMRKRCETNENLKPDELFK